MLGAKLQILSEIIYMEAVKKMKECGVSPSLACLVLQGVKAKFEEDALTDLSLQLLQNTEIKKEKEDSNTGTIEDLKKELERKGVEVEKISGKEK